MMTVLMQAVYSVLGRRPLTAKLVIPATPTPAAMIRFKLPPPRPADWEADLLR